MPERADRPQWTRFGVVALIVLLPTALVVFVVFAVFGAGRGSRPDASGPVTAAPVLAGSQSATRDLIASLDPALGCIPAEQVTLARVDDLVAGGRLDVNQVPPPAGAVTCAGGGLDRDYVVFARAGDARSLFDVAAAAAGAGPVADGPGQGCRNFAAIGTGAVVVTCTDHPDVVWTARSEGADAASVLGQLGR